MEILGIPSDSMILQSRKKDHYFDTDLSPFLIEDPQLGIVRIPDGKPLAEAVPTTDLYLLDFMAKCLEMNPEQRMSAREGLQHPFICGKQKERYSSPLSKINQETYYGKSKSPIKKQRLEQIVAVSDPMIMR